MKSSNNEGKRALCMKSSVTQHCPGHFSQPHEHTFFPEPLLKGYAIQSLAIIFFWEICKLESRVFKELAIVPLFHGLQWWERYPGNLYYSLWDSLLLPDHLHGTWHNVQKVKMLKSSSQRKEMPDLGGQKTGLNPKTKMNVLCLHFQVHRFLIKIMISLGKKKVAIGCFPSTEGKERIFLSGFWTSCGYAAYFVEEFCWNM